VAFAWTGSFLSTASVGVVEKGVGVFVSVWVVVAP
jgi:uncharacterized membrane protein